MARQINLYDPALERQRDWLALHNIVGLTVLVAVLVGVSGYLTRRDLPALTAQAASGETRLKAARDQVAVLGQQAARKPDPRLAQDIEARRALLDMRGEVLAVLRRSLGPESRSFAAYLQGFAGQAMPDVWLTGFSVSAGGAGLEIRGRTTTPALLPEYIGRLNRETAFQGQTFSALKLDAAKPAAGSTPVAGSPPVAGSAPVPEPRPVWHEFVLVPVSMPDAAPPIRAVPGKAG